MYFEVSFDKKITYKKVLEGYSKGIFPMGDVFDNSLSWYFTDPRGIIKLEPDFKGINIPRSLKQVLKKNLFEVKVDTKFKEVIDNCSYRFDTWITPKIKKLYITLHNKGYAHSVETYQGNKLVGGLYGVAYKGAFFGESMFYIEPNASKVAFIKLYEILIKNNYLLFDIQMITPVFKILGAINIPIKVYHQLLSKAMSVEREFLY